MTEQEMEACWKDRGNYKWGLYYCKSDPRPIVPKRIKWMGWTFNAARPSVIPATLALFAILLGPVLVAKANDASNAAQMCTLVASILTMCLFCAFLSSPKLWRD
jgi:hypothetical protein